MFTLHVRLFGRFSVQREEQLLPGFDIRKVQELFTYLLLNRQRPHAREALAELFWPDNTVAQSKKLLRQTLWQLQAALGSSDKAGSDYPVLLVEPDWVQLNPQAALWLDVALFEQAFNQVQGVEGSTLSEEQVQALEEAVGLYQGDLLEGWYLDWCIYERERLHNVYLAMLDKLMDYSEARQDYDTGLIYGLRILCHDRTRERTHRRLMRLHYLAGDRAAALRQYERCVAALQEELNVKPSRRTVSLHEQIRADRVAGHTLAQLEPNQALEKVTAPLPDLLDHLQQLHTLMGEIQHLLGQDIQTLETTLGGHLSQSLPRPV